MTPSLLCLSGLKLYLKYPHSSTGTCINKQETGWGNTVSHKRSTFVYNDDSFLSMLSLDRVGDGMETQTQRQTQEKTAPFISILLLAVINYFITIHFSYSQEMILWLFVLRASNRDLFQKTNNLCLRSSEQVKCRKC